jgi:carbonic anhydrase
MEKLVRGIHQFQSEYFRPHRELFAQLAQGQHPEAMLITCSDSRVSPTLLTQAKPGDIFVLRNAGNIVPPYGASQGGEAATIEYAVRVLGVKDIIICGHSHCGAMKGLIAPPNTGELPAVRSWLGHAESTRAIVKEKYAHLDDHAKHEVTIEENVLVQLENLRTHPAVAAKLSRAELHLHGWVYNFETGQVFNYDLKQGQFVKLSEPAEAASAA